MAEALLDPIRSEVRRNTMSGADDAVEILASTLASEPRCSARSCMRPGTAASVTSRLQSRAKDDEWRLHHYRSLGAAARALPDRQEKRMRNTMLPRPLPPP
jgi:hypothetical protein